MSSTAWRYFVPYQSDYQAAIDALRAHTFEQGAYLQPWTDRDHAPLPPPESIEEAVQRCGEDGTHSILDIVAFSLIPGPGLACLVSRADRMRIYGTPNPTREDIADHRFALVHTLDLNEARILTVYDEDGAPESLYLEGLSGG